MKKITWEPYAFALSTKAYAYGSRVIFFVYWVTIEKIRISNLRTFAVFERPRTIFFHVYAPRISPFMQCSQIGKGSKSFKVPWSVSYHQLPFGLPANAIRSTGKCRSGYRQLPFGNFERSSEWLYPRVYGNRASEMFPKLRMRISWKRSDPAYAITDPDVVFIEPSSAKDGQVTERAYSYVFVKTFKKEDENVRYYSSVTVSIDGMEISVSSHYINSNKAKKNCWSWTADIQKLH